MARWTVSNVKSVDDEEGSTYHIGDVTMNGETKRMCLFICPSCGRFLKPGSINDDEGYHVDGCDGYFLEPTSWDDETP